MVDFQNVNPQNKQERLPWNTPLGPSHRLSFTHSFGVMSLPTGGSMNPIAKIGLVLLA